MGQSPGKGEWLSLLEGTFVCLEGEEGSTKHGGPVQLESEGASSGRGLCPAGEMRHP